MNTEQIKDMEIKIAYQHEKKSPDQVVKRMLNRLVTQGIEVTKYEVSAYTTFNVYSIEFYFTGDADKLPQSFYFREELKNANT
jgi:hypothetical protein